MYLGKHRVYNPERSQILDDPLKFTPLNAVGRREPRCLKAF